VSGSLIPISDEQAKLGREILQTLRGLGSFIEKALGSVPEDLIAYLGGDWLRFRRADNIARLLQGARSRLSERNVPEPKPASLSIALPILRAGADEDREDLVDLWTRLLANAMDPNLANVRYSFIEAVKAMDPIDAVILRFLHNSDLERIYRGQRGSTGSQETNTILIADALCNRSDEIEVSFEHLESLRFFSPINMGWDVNALNREFMRACYPEMGT
jgi:hypothetical protein